ncbi:MAG: hypothetical protein D6793_00945 [Thermoflexia bacterium]|nr:MAG: hypothetical protein D6793_00945 [Thermoflexia bacterium]
MGENLNPAPMEQREEETHALSYTERKQRWLREELGLRFDPFEYLDGGADPNLPRYLVDHGAFAALWGDWPAFLFAPPGGGKTAFRVRLMRACRVGQEGRKIFPVLFRPPRPRRADEPVPEEEFFNTLLRDAGAGLLFQLAYQPQGFLELPYAERRILRRLLEQTLPAPLDYYLLQLKDAGSLNPLAQAFDPTARDLPAEPLPPTIRLFCETLSENGHREELESVPPAGQMVGHFFQTLFSLLRYESIYLLVDGADAYTQDPLSIVRIVEPLLNQLRDLAERKIFVKFFLPGDVAPQIPDTLLTEPTKVVIINWKRDSLAAILRERLYVASEGMYDALEAIATRDIPSPAGECLAEAAHPAVPREVILLAQRLFTEHILRVGPYGLLEAADFDNALRWYRAQRRAEA